MPVRAMCGAGLVSAAVLALAACGVGPQSGTSPTESFDELVIVTPTRGSAPLRSPTAATGQRYVVREGDTLSGIAARFDVTEDAILRANGLQNPDRIFVGQELVIPPPEP